MINPKELRIGNFVSSKEFNIIEIDSIYLNGDTYWLNPTVEYYVLDGYRCKDIEPILITKKWLLRFGFRPVGENHPDTMACYSDRFSMYLFVLDSGILFRAGNGDIEIKYVHQLQNLYFALTGEELEIKELTA